MFVMRLEGGAAIYEQLCARITELISSGTLTEGEKLLFAVLSRFFRKKEKNLDIFEKLCYNCIKRNNTVNPKGGSYVCHAA